MCFVCDSIAEPCSWQLAKCAETHFAGWEELEPCGMCDDEFDDFVTELGLTKKVTHDIGCQAGETAAVFQARQHANPEVRRRAVDRNVVGYNVWCHCW